MSMRDFTYVNKYGTYPDCNFMVGHYANGNIGIEIWSNTEGPIIKVTVNPGIKLNSDRIAIKDYSENEGMSDWLKSMDLIEEHPCQIILSGHVDIPVYKLTKAGIKEFAV